MIAGGFREGVDSVLIDFEPIGLAEIGAGRFLKFSMDLRSDEGGLG
jgi:hypothetical protein